MKLLLFIAIFILFSSCSGGGEGSNRKDSKNFPTGMTKAQQQAQALIKSDIQSLQSGQYGISQSDLALLKKEGLISHKEMNSLNVVK